MTDINQQLQELHNQFPELEELEEANPFVAAGLAAGKSLGKSAYNLATKIPVAGKLVKGVGNIVGNAYTAGKTAAQSAAQANAAEVAKTQSSGLAGLQGSILISNLFDTIQTYANSPDQQPQEQEQAPQEQPEQTQPQEQSPQPQRRPLPPRDASGRFQTQAAANTDIRGQTTENSRIRTYAQLLQELGSFRALYEDRASDQARFKDLMKAFIQKVPSKEALLQNPKLLAGLPEIINQARRLKIPGFETFNKKEVQNAVASAETPQPQQPEAQSQQENLTDQQAQQIVRNMDQRKLSQLVLSDPVAAKAVASAVMKNSQ